ncbi:MAG: hypothetical protein PHT44_03535 [Candidatus Portnoybacteria bacterium]|nr:hypothetical protein [Candidatus Portnoybacteria bacterium]MDD4983100.1 hypothetical protein [Candidatus Portnoybacteria bacterium]
MARNILIITYYCGDAGNNDYLANCLKKAREENAKDIIVMGGAEWSNDESRDQAESEVKKLLRMSSINEGFRFQPMGGKLKTALSALIYSMKIAGIAINKIVVCAQRSQLDRYQREALAIKDLGLIKLSTHEYRPPDATSGKEAKYESKPKRGLFKKILG